MPTLSRCAVATMLSIVLLAASCGDDTPSSDQPSSDQPSSDQPSSDGPASSSIDPTGPADTTDSTPWPVEPPTSPSVARWTVEIVERLDHDPAASTQGLEVVDGVGYESTGRYGESTIRRFDPATGRVSATVALDDTLFGEGLTVIDGVVVQLTWKAGLALRWDAASLEPLGSSPFAGEHEGWGLCADNGTLLLSDGSSSVRRVDPADFTVLSSVEVRDDGEAVTLLNELECVDGLVIANVWKSDRLVVFDPGSGVVVAEIDAAPLVREMADAVAADAQNVLNGIARLDDDTFLLSGKRWPTTFRVRLVEA